MANIQSFKSSQTIKTTLDAFKFINIYIYMHIYIYIIYIYIHNIYIHICGSSTSSTGSPSRDVKKSSNHRIAPGHLSPAILRALVQGWNPDSRGEHRKKWFILILLNSFISCIYTYISYYIIYIYIYIYMFMYNSYVCMYVCMYVCKYVCMYVSTYVCMYVGR